MKRFNRGQVTVETAVLFSAVVGAFLLLFIYVQRAAQGGIKGNADSLGSQLSITTPWSSVSHQRSLSVPAASQTTSCSQTQQQLVSTVGGATGGGSGVTVPAQDCDALMLDPNQAALAGTTYITPHQ